MLKNFLLISVLIMSTLAIGCAGSPHLSKSYGKSYKACFSAQVINHETPNDRTPADKMPGYLGIQIYNDIYLPEMTGGTGANIK